jgi:hypothetical protein
MLELDQALPVTRHTLSVLKGFRGGLPQLKSVVTDITQVRGMECCFRGNYQSGSNL